MRTVLAASIGMHDDAFGGVAKYAAVFLQSPAPRPVRPAIALAWHFHRLRTAYGQRCFHVQLYS